MHFDRRGFLKFMGGTTLAGISAGSSSMSFLSSALATDKALKFTPLKPTSEDGVKLAEGLVYDLVVKWGDQINKSEAFGYNNDYTAFFPLKGKNDEGILWVNHEAPGPIIMNTIRRTKVDIDTERKALGGSLVHLKKDKKGNWNLVKDSQYNRRVTGETKIPFAGGVKVKGQDFAIGTFANCAGGVTPWGHVLTCEENYQDFYGEVDYKTGKKIPAKGWYLNWDKYYDMPPEHYGWVVEVNPLTGEAKKHTSIGRFAHECATCIEAKDGRTVVYSGDDANNEHIYKFISDKKGSLDSGELFVADITNGKWISLDIKKNKKLQETFKTQIDVLTNCRVAGKIVGATPCDRPEDIEIDPKSGDVFVCLTNNKGAGNHHGKILKITETNGDHLSSTFKTSDFAIGGEASGFSCPDNIVFDKAGNLWMSTDISGSSMNKGKYSSFKNNGIFYFPLSGPNAGVAHQVASAPVDAEFTGLCFDSEGNRLFVSVQHPGERSSSLNNLTSHWPEGGGSVPKPGVIQIHGPLFERLMRS